MIEINIVKVRENEIDRKEIVIFLEKFNLTLDIDVEYTAKALLNNEIVGTCSYCGKVLKCFAVNKEFQGEGIAAKLITHLTNILFDKGIYETFIFTKPANRVIFESIGYSEVYSCDDVVLLEGGMANVKKYVENMFIKSSLGSEEKAGLVMNCNPFTLGHRYLIERAAKENKEVVVFIVEENRSSFPFKVRLDLLKKGTFDLKNVKIIPGGDYIISSNTFPSYFLRQEDERLRAFTELDAGIFGKYIAPIFNIKRRYVGTEPYDRVTEKYNTALSKVLPSFDVEIKLIERLLLHNTAISASEVRRLLKVDNWDKIRAIVPITTFEFLKSTDALEIIKRLKRSDSPH